MSENFNVYSSFSPAEFGSDLDVSGGVYGGDLLADENGDLAVVSGWENLSEAIRRRLGTIKGFLSAFVRDVEGLSQVDFTYGNPAYRYLSEPLDNNTMNGLRQGVQECLLEEDRIRVQDVRVTLVPVGHSLQLVLDVTYSEAGSNQSQSIRLAQTGNDLEII